MGASAKILGVFVPSYFLKHNKSDAIFAGIVMVPRGEYAVIAVHMALAATLITSEIYTIVVAFALLSMILTPLILRLLKNRL